MNTDDDSCWLSIGQGSKNRMFATVLICDEASAFANADPSPIRTDSSSLHHVRRHEGILLRGSLFNQKML
jgi:hypothetical protein